MAWLNLTRPNQTIKNGLKVKRWKCTKWIFFSRKTTNKILMYLLAYAPFILQNLKKFLRADPELQGCAIFDPKMAHLSWTNFFGTNHYCYFHLPIGTFHCTKFKKLLQQIPSYKDMPFLGPKWSICPKTNFFLENY